MSYTQFDWLSAGVHPNLESRIYIWNKFVKWYTLLNTVQICRIVFQRYVEINGLRTWQSPTVFSLLLFCRTCMSSSWFALVGVPYLICTYIRGKRSSANRFLLFSIWRFPFEWFTLFFYFPFSAYINLFYTINRWVKVTLIHYKS